VASCHDISDGGLAVALAETAFAGDLGLTVELGNMAHQDTDRDDFLLFSETPGRLVVTVPSVLSELFETLMMETACLVGEVTADKRLVIVGQNNRVVVDEDISELKQVWQKPLSFQGG
jgi:phosphoribosylformylglycinamidine synthase